MSAKRGLGRNFDSLIPSELMDESFDPTANQDEQVSDLRQIQISKIQPDPDQPRRYFDELALQELSTSIQQHGVLQPIVVTAKGDGYQVVAGERRYRAALAAGLDKLPALVRTLTDQHRLELSLIENLQRRDLNPLETATAYLKLRDQFNLTLDEIGQRVGGKSVSAVSNTLRLLRLPEAVRQAISEGKLSEGQARPLINLEPEAIQDILPQIIREEWSARRIEQFIVQLKKQASAAQKDSARPVETIPYQDSTAKLQKHLATKVSVKTNAKGAGKIIIDFTSDDEFQRLQKLLKD